MLSRGFPWGQTVRKLVCQRPPRLEEGISETPTRPGSSAGASFGDHLGIILASRSSRVLSRGFPWGQTVRKLVCQRPPRLEEGISETPTRPGSSAGASFGDHLGIILASRSSRAASERFPEWANSPENSPEIGREAGKTCYYVFWRAESEGNVDTYGQLRQVVAGTVVLCGKASQARQSAAT